MNHRIEYINDIPIEEIKYAFAKFNSIENVYGLRRMFALRGINAVNILDSMDLIYDGNIIYTLYNLDNERVEIAFTTSDYIFDSMNRSRGWPLFDNIYIYSNNLPSIFQIGGNRFEFIEEYGILYIIYNTSNVYSFPNLFNRFDFSLIDFEEVEQKILDG